MEGRGYSDFYRNTSEELFIRSVMENSVGGGPVPTMEMLGFRNISHSLRTDSEELFKSWLTSAEARNPSTLIHVDFHLSVLHSQIHFFGIYKACIAVQYLRA